MGDSRVSRRTLLGAAVTTAVAAGLSNGLGGCVPGPSAPPPQTQTPIAPLTSVLLLQQELRAHYQRVLEAFPELAGALTDFHTQTTAHTEALLAAAPAAAEQIAAAGSGSTSGTSSPSVPAPPPPGDVVTALTELKQAVDEAAGSLLTAALRADGDLAALLGSCAASTTCHGRLLA